MNPTPRSLRLRRTVCSIALVSFAALAIGCTTVRPVPPPPELPPAWFDHAPFGRVLERAVDDRGRVDYLGLLEDPGELPAYFASLAEVSPDTDADRFPTPDHELAYWINAYNAATITLVLDAYPIGSVLDVKNPRALFFFPKLAGFFVFRRFELGGDATSLYFLENQIVRKRFGEPRIHFALNCASASCPRLPREPFLPATLQEQLEREARLFFSEKRNVWVDDEDRIVYLSSILDWYEDDYLDWMELVHPELPRDLVTYASLYAPPDVAERLRAARDAEYEIEFFEYDWSLNDQQLPDPFAND